MGPTLSLTLKIWRQPDAESRGNFETYQLDDVSPDMSFLEMLDVLNERLILEGGEPVAFDHDCREGICGTCGMMINGQAHGPDAETTTCQLHMRRFHDGDTIVIEPWRARAFPVVRDLVVDRSAFDRIMKAGGYISVNTGNAPRRQCHPRPARRFGACDERGRLHRLRGVRGGVQKCLRHAVCERQGLALGPVAAGKARTPRARRHRMVAQMDAEGFGSCTVTEECEAACPAGISINNIGRLNREYIKGMFAGE